MVTNCPSYGHNGSAYKIRAEKGLRRPEYRGSIQVPEAADLSSRQVYLVPSDKGHGAPACYL